MPYKIIGNAKVFDHRDNFEQASYYAEQKKSDPRISARAV